MGTSSVREATKLVGFNFFRVPLSNTVSHCWILTEHCFLTASDKYLDLCNYNNLLLRGERHAGFRIGKANGTKINFSDRS